MHPILRGQTRPTVIAERHLLAGPSVPRQQPCTAPRRCAICQRIGNGPRIARFSATLASLGYDVDANPCAHARCVSLALAGTA
jgi:hypothetical protein